MIRQMYVLSDSVPCFLPEVITKRHGSVANAYPNAWPGNESRQYIFCPIIAVSIF